MSGIPVIFVLAIALLCLFVGGWLGRLLTRYPWGQKPFTGKENMIGKVARVVEVHDNSLAVRYNNLTWSAEFAGEGTIEVGESVTISGVSGNRLTVQKP